MTTTKKPKIKKVRIIERKKETNYLGSVILFLIVMGIVYIFTIVTSYMWSDDYKITVKGLLISTGIAYGALAIIMGMLNAETKEVKIEREVEVEEIKK